MPVLKWGILGCANIAMTKVIPGMLQSPSSRIVAIASRGAEKAQQAAEVFGIERAYGSYEELLADPEVEAVYIPLPNHLHREWTLRAIQAGKHVLCEKPLALTFAEAEEMAEAARQAGVTLVEAFMYRHHPQMLLARKLLQEGAIGDVRLVRGSFTFNNASDHGNVRYVKEWGGGSLYDVGCYPIHAARMLLGREPEAVTVHALFSEEHGGVDMMASGTVEFPDGVALQFDCGMWAAFRESVEVVGTEGTLTVPAPFVPAKDASAEVWIHAGGGLRKETVEPADSYTLQAEEFAAAVFEGRAPAYPASDAVANMRVLEAALRSAERRERVVLE